MFTISPSHAVPHPQDHSALVFNADTGVIVSTLSGHGNPFTSVSLSHNDSLVLGACEDANLRLYDLTTDKMVRLVF